MKKMQMVSVMRFMDKRGSGNVARTRAFVIAVLAVAALACSGCGSSSSSSNSFHPPDNPPPVNSTVIIMPATATVFRGETVRFTAKVSGLSDQSVTWSAPTGFGTIDTTGLYTAPANFDGVSTNITATSKAAPEASGSAVVNLPKVTLAIAPDAVAIMPGANSTFSATVDGLNSAQVAWTVRSTTGGSITSSGKYTAPLTKGLYYVDATSTVNSNYRASAVALVTPTPSSFSPTGDTKQRHALHTATLLPNGKVLVAGGYVYEAYCVTGIDSTELYDPVSGSFASTSNMATRRYAHTATRLANGDVLIAGGFTFDESLCWQLEPSPAVKSTELYEHTQGSFQSSGSLTEERGGHTATLLTNGKVLIAGGGKLSSGWFPSDSGNGSITAELYGPSTGLFTSTGSMNSARVGHTATLLANGKVLITGGWSSSGAITTAELYDPVSGNFTATGSMSFARAAHTATLLHDGTVLITGGSSDQSNAGSDRAEIYDPNTGSFAVTGSMAVPRRSHTATLLANNTVLVVGGGSKIAEIFDPATNSFSPAGITEFDRSGHSATQLPSGKVMFVGGFDPAGSLSPLGTAEFYQ